MSLEQFRANAGFPADELIRQMKRDVGVPGKVRVLFDNPLSQARSSYTPDGVLVIHLAPLETILRQRPDLTKEEAISKIKAQIAEELCHGVHHETDHNEAVVGCTIKEMKLHLSPEEMQYPYIEEKVRRLEQAQQPIVGMPIRN